MSLALVVADPGAPPAVRRRAVAAARRELEGGDELVWVGASAPPAGARHVQVDHAGRGTYYEAGLRVTGAAYVAFSDATTELAPGWRAAAVGGLGAGAHVVGGPVVPDDLRSRRSAAGFLVEYGPHAVAPFVNAAGDVAANNVAYRRQSLAQVLRPGEGVWKAVVNSRLAADGLPPVAVPGMCVTSLKEYTWSDVTTTRFAHGRLYGATRAVSWRPWRRAVGAVLCAGLPVLALARVAAIVRRDPFLRAHLVRSSPAVAAALLAWSAGEANGYLGGKANEDAVF